MAMVIDTAKQDLKCSLCGGKIKARDKYIRNRIEGKVKGKKVDLSMNVFHFFPCLTTAIKGEKGLK